MSIGLEYIIMLTYVNKSGSIKNAATQLYGVGQVNLAVAAYKAALKNRSEAV